MRLVVYMLAAVFAFLIVGGVLIAKKYGLENEFKNTAYENKYEVREELP